MCAYAKWSSGSRLLVDIAMWCLRISADCTRCCKCLHASACHSSRRDESPWRSLWVSTQSSSSRLHSASHCLCSMQSVACLDLNRSEVRWFWYSRISVWALCSCFHIIPGFWRWLRGGRLSTLKVQLPTSSRANWRLRTLTLSSVS